MNAWNGMHGMSFDKVQVLHVRTQRIRLGETQWKLQFNMKIATLKMIFNVLIYPMLLPPTLLNTNYQFLDN